MNKKKKFKFFFSEMKWELIERLFAASYIHWFHQFMNCALLVIGFPPKQLIQLSLSFHFNQLMNQTFQLYSLINQATLLLSLCLLGGTAITYLFNHISFLLKKWNGLLNQPNQRERINESNSPAWRGEWAGWEGGMNQQRKLEFMKVWFGGEWS